MSRQSWVVLYVCIAKTRQIYSQLLTWLTEGALGSGFRSKVEQNSGSGFGAKVTTKKFARFFFCFLL